MIWSSSDILATSSADLLKKGLASFAANDEVVHRRLLTFKVDDFDLEEVVVLARQADHAALLAGTILQLTLANLLTILPKLVTLDHKHVLDVIDLA